MTIRFSCPKCGTHFVVADKAAGRMGRCKKCAHRVKIPEAHEAVAAPAVSGRFHLAQAEAVVAATGVGLAKVAEQPEGEEQEQGEDGKWRRVVADVETLGIVPVTHSALKAIQRKAARDVDDDDDDDGAFVGNYGLQSLVNEPIPVNRGPTKYVHRQKFKAGRLYSRGVGALLGSAQGLSQLAFVITWVFVMLLLFGTVTQQRTLAIVGAIGVVLLCLAQIALNFAYMVLMPFQGSPRRALEFFLPPYKKRQRKQVYAAIGGVIGPIIPIIGVVLVFSFVPSLSKSGLGEDATLQERIEAEVDVLQDDVKKTLEQGADAVNQGLERAKTASQEVDLQGLQDKVKQGVDGLMNSSKQESAESTSQEGDDQGGSATDRGN